MSDNPRPAAKITDLLIAWGDGGRGALDELLPLVYAELKRLATRYLRRESAGHTLQPTALVHEAYLRLVDQRRVRWRNRAHFYGIAAQIMRRILVDHARARHAGKRGAGWRRVPLVDENTAAGAPDVDVLALDEALRRLSAFDGRQERIVELRYFGGLTIDETADVVGVSTATVVREWTVAKAWLRAELEKPNLE
jgi:RNA polymerase sigma factor (TIGR02999 family)